MSSTRSLTNPTDTQILAALPEEEAARLFPQLKVIEFPLGMSINESVDVQRYIYFPTESIVSLLYVLQDCASAEIAVVCNEGAIGVALFMGGETTPSRAIVQSAGLAYRLSSRALKKEFGRHGQMLHLRCPIRSRSSRKWRRPLSATGTTPLTSAGRSPRSTEKSSRSCRANADRLLPHLSPVAALT